MPVRVDDHGHRVGRELADVREDLAALPMGETGVDDEGLAIAQDDADLLVEEAIPAGEDAIADLDPGLELLLRKHGWMVPRRGRPTTLPAMPASLHHITAR